MTPTTSQIEQLRRPAFIVGAVGAVLCAAAATLDTSQMLRSYLIGFLFWWSISLGCLGLLVLHNLVGGGWGNGVRHYWRAALITLPLMGALFLPIAFGLQQVYVWAADHDHSLAAEKLQYLNAPFFWSRAAGYFLFWLLLAWFFGRRQWSFLRHVTPALRGWSGPSLVLLVLTVTFAAVDWVMSLDPHWHSTIFGGLFVADAGLAALLLSVICATRMGVGGDQDESQKFQCLQDLGNLMLGFVMLWTYFAFSQFMIIWAGNLPEESSWTLARIQNGWQWLALAVVVLHFAVPFLLLFSRDVKRNPVSMFRVAVLLLVARVADLVWTVQPAFESGGFTSVLGGLSALAGIGGLWIAVFSLGLQRCLQDERLHVSELEPGELAMEHH